MLLFTSQFSLVLLTSTFIPSIHVLHFPHSPYIHVCMYYWVIHIYDHLFFFLFHFSSPICIPWSFLTLFSSLLLLFFICKVKWYFNTHLVSRRINIKNYFEEVISLALLFFLLFVPALPCPILSFPFSSALARRRRISPMNVPFCHSFILTFAHWPVHLLVPAENLCEKEREKENKRRNRPSLSPFSVVSIRSFDFACPFVPPPSLPGRHLLSSLSSKLFPPVGLGLPFSIFPSCSQFLPVIRSDFHPVVSKWLY